MSIELKGWPSRGQQSVLGAGSRKWHLIGCVVQGAVDSR